MYLHTKNELSRSQLHGNTDRCPQMQYHAAFMGHENTEAVMYANEHPYLHNAATMNDVTGYVNKHIDNKCCMHTFAVFITGRPCQEHSSSLRMN